MCNYVMYIVLALYACRSFTTDEDPWIGVETFGSLTNSNCPNSSPASVVPEISPCRYLATQKSSEISKTITIPRYSA